MKKLIVIALAVAAASLISVADVQAQEGDLEVSGHVNIVTGWQRTHGNAGCSALGCPTGSAGILTDGLLLPGGPGVDQFGFFVDEVELDLAKQFGENIRLRADIDFNPGGNRTEAVGGIVGLEQAYITVNVPMGNGGELLFGRFNSGVGLDPIDRNELSTISFSTIHRTLLPHNITGMNLYYAFNENVSLDIFVVNNLADSYPFVGGNTDIPSMGFNLEWATGDFGEGTWVRFSGLAGPERGTKLGWSFMGDLAASIGATDAFYIDFEGIYRQDDSAALPASTKNFKYVGGTLQLRYAFSDIWDGTLRYGFLWDVNAGGTNGFSTVAPNPLSPVMGMGLKGQQHDLTLATGYEITDGARFVIEGRYDLQRSSVGSGKTSVYGVAGGFYYDF